VLVYDGGCPFCIATARWLQRHAREPVRLVTFDEVGASGVLVGMGRDASEAAAHFVTPDGGEYHGGAAVTRALRLLRFGGVAAVLDLPVASLARDAGYAVVARLRPWLSRFVHPPTR
jgi:predicted DCC family thiol-disulfide oxidoreductase YuxK